MGNGLILAPFAGPGGWSEGLASLGRADIGIELDAAACATRRAAGHLTIRADVSTYPLGHLVGKVEGLILSPPCPDFSSAGRRKGTSGKSGWLIYEVPRWVLTLRPKWVACEQVPEALPYWRTFAQQFREVGYHCWAGILCAADYGVPQERYRAFLMAHTDRPVHPPPPTHAEHPADGGMFGEATLSWVSMAQGLGWGMTERAYVTVTTGGAKSGGADAMLVGGSGARRTLERERESVSLVGYRRTRGAGMNERHGGRPDTPADRPAPTITSKARTDLLVLE